MTVSLKILSIKSAGVHEEKKKKSSTFLLGKQIKIVTVSYTTEVPNKINKAITI